MDQLESFISILQQQVLHINLLIGLSGKLASIMAEYSDSIASEVGFSGFFLIFTIIPFMAGLAMLALNNPLKKMMHGIDK